MPSIIKLREILVLLVTGAACGPEGTEKIDALFGTYSALPAGISNRNTYTVRNFVIEPDGTFVIGGYFQCGAGIGTPEELRWVRRGDEAIDVRFPDAGEGGIDTWRISRGADCNQIRVESRREGEAVGDAFYARGEVCLEMLPPCPGGHCDSCGTVWCDGPPPPCDAATP
jgi:hypothetical protein